MLELTQRTALAGSTGAGAPRTQDRGHRLTSTWSSALSIVNLRLDPTDAAATAAVAEVLGLALPLAACSTCGDARLRIVWAGPDDWFLIGPAGQAAGWITQLSAVLAGPLKVHHALTDVSSGYRVLRLAGPAARELLAQGCPLDLHARAFQPGMSAGTVYFKASIWLWQADGAAPADPTFDVLVRSSFQGYVQLMIERGRAACGLA